MRNRTVWILILALSLLLCACGENTPPTQKTAWKKTVHTLAPELSTAPPEVTQAPETEPPVTAPEHSPLYIPGVSVEDVILFYSEVALDSEYYDSGNPSNVQKWTAPIYYTVEGSYTAEDLTVLQSFTDWLNTVEGFPGMYTADNSTVRNLQIHFCSQQELITLMGKDFENMDGAVTFWYDYDEIYDAIICIRSDLDQELRNSIILEEVYNGLGPIQDTVLRPDSIIYEEFSQPQWLTPMDELILRLLYHPDIRPGMDAQQCEQIIRTLYY